MTALVREEQDALRHPPLAQEISHQGFSTQYVVYRPRHENQTTHPNIDARSATTRSPSQSAQTCAFICSPSSDAPIFTTCRLATAPRPHMRAEQPWQQNQRGAATKACSAIRAPRRRRKRPRSRRPRAEPPRAALLAHPKRRAARGAAAGRNALMPPGVCGGFGSGSSGGGGGGGGGVCVGCVVGWLWGGTPPRSA